MKTGVQDFMFFLEDDNNTTIKIYVFMFFCLFLSKKLSDFDFSVEGVDEFLVV